MPVQKICPKCGKPAAAIMKFCDQCGAPLNQVTVAPQATAVISHPPAPPSKPFVSVEPSPAAEPDLIPVGQETDAEKPSWYIPPAGKNAAPPTSPPTPGSSPSSAGKFVTVAGPKPVSPAKPSAPAAGIMSNKMVTLAAGIGIIILIVIALVVFPVFNGNPVAPKPSTYVPTSPPSPSPAVSYTSVTTPQPTGSPSFTSLPADGGAVSMVPGPTQVMPVATNVLITADKDTVTGAISLQIAGGPGKSVVKEVRGTVYRSDGQTSTGTLNPAGPSQEVVIPGSKGTDRVVVTVVLFSGDQYVVLDKLMTFRARG